MWWNNAVFKISEKKTPKIVHDGRMGRACKTVQTPATEWGKKLYPQQRQMIVGNAKELSANYSVNEKTGGFRK